MSADSERRSERRSKDFVARADKPQERKRKPPTIGERLLSLKAGAYWTMEELTAIEASDNQTVEMRRRAEYALEDIEKYGKDALSHLCLDGLFHNALRRDGVTTISQLEACVSNGGASNIAIGGRFVLASLDIFHQRLAKEQSTQPSSSSPPS